METKTEMETGSFEIIAEPFIAVEDDSPIEVGWTSGHVVAAALVIAYAAVLLVIALNGVIR